jgi:Rab-GTPase-TBC domain
VNPNATINDALPATPGRRSNQSTPSASPAGAHHSRSSSSVDIGHLNKATLSVLLGTGAQYDPVHLENVMRLSYKDRMKLLLYALKQSVLPIALLRSIAFNYGVGERRSIRSLMWKILVGYLPKDTKKWKQLVADHRRDYAHFVKDLIVNPYARFDSGPSGPPANPAVTSDTSEPTISEPLMADPLGVHSSPEWDTYFKDQEIREEIKKDISRTYHSFHFFRTRVNPHLADPVEPEPDSPGWEYGNGSGSSSRATKKPTKSLFGDFSLDDDDKKLPSVLLSSPSPSNSNSAHSGATAAAAVTENTSASDSAVGDAVADAVTPLPVRPVTPTATTASASTSAITDGANSTPASSPAHDNKDAGADKPDADKPCRPNSEPQDCHHDVLLRILFIFAKLNPGIRYVQGMNEILAPLYYVFSVDPDAEWSEHAEADAFFTFSIIMSELRDRFIKTLDSSSSGVLAVVKTLDELICEVDKPVWKRLKSQGIDPRFYAFRWITLLLSQEFELPDVLRLWDSLFGDPDRWSFLLYMCCAMVCNMKPGIMRNDFATNVNMLQNYPDIDVQILINLAHDIRRKIGRRLSPGVGGLVTQVSMD